MDILITRITATEWQFSPLLQNLKLLLFNGVSGSCVNVTKYNIFYCYCFSKKDVIIAYFTHQLKSCQRISLGLSVALFWLGNCQKISSRKRHAPMCDPFFHPLLCHRACSKDFISIILVPCHEPLSLFLWDGWKLRKPKTD